MLDSPSNAGPCFPYWGKAAPNPDEKVTWHPLVFHSLDVAAVGRLILEKQPLLRQRLVDLTGLPEHQLVKWCVFLLGLHDLGKFAESFQQLREDLRQYLWPDQKIRKHHYTVRHDSLGWMLWLHHLKGIALQQHPDESVGGWIEDTFPYWLAAVFGHHGWPPDDQDRLKSHFREFDKQAALAFFQEWQALNQIDFAQLSGSAQDPGFRKRQQRASWLLAGVAVLADWLGSNRDYFSFHDQPMSLASYWQERALTSAEHALAAACIEPSTPHPEQALSDLFDYIQEPTPLQRTCAELTLTETPQLFILEDVTGAGKTEAALMLAHRLMAKGLAQGVYIGLPTMATANAMYERMARVYRRLYGEDAHPSLILSHGARHLSKAFRQSLLDARADAERYGNEESIGAQCNRWLADNRKKALLADVGVGTVDQALLGVMPARHQSLRLLGLAGKVLILDEVHAYDAYTSTALRQLIRFHSGLGGSVVLLSATLTNSQRHELVHAFCDGRGKTLTRTAYSDYPLLTHVSARSELLVEQVLETRRAVRRKVEVAFCHAENEAIHLIREAVEQGHCVCWIRNTVADAREAWARLTGADWMPENKLHLFHSRYALADRLDIESRMLDLFGKPPQEIKARNAQAARRHGQVLIATQVVEQSLDLDFDVLISDLAPVDLLIQRAGRLHRHDRGERGTPRLTVHAPPFESQPDPDWYKNRFPRAHFVYSDTLVLWRTQRLLEQKRGWRMPDDARELLEQVYDEEGEIPKGLQDAHLAVEGETYGQRDAANFATLNLDAGYLRTTQWDEEARIATRLGEESQMLYLARWQGGQLEPWQTDAHYPWDMSSLRVNARQLHSVAEPDDELLKQALERLREQEPRFDNDTLIVPLRLQEGAWKASGGDEKGRAIAITYHSKTGLELTRD